MEFNEKLQHLRKQHNMTQEQLAEKLYVTRAAVSKWESGKGYPNIESLKAISSLFAISIDELLSGNELLELAETENRSNLKRIYNIIGGVVDLLAIVFIFFPLYRKTQGNFIYSVNLLSFTEITSFTLFIYWTIFILLICLGITKLIFMQLHKDIWCSYITKGSIGLGALAICLFAVAREPYVTPLLFLLFATKVVLLIKEIQSK